MRNFRLERVRRPKKIMQQNIKIIMMLLRIIPTMPKVQKRIV